GGALAQVVIDANRDLNVTAGSIGNVVSKLTLAAGREFAQDLTPVNWIVTGANGELRVTSGGDLVVRFLSQLKADGLIALTSTGYDDDGDMVGGNLMVVEELRGFSSANPRNVTLSAANLLHIQQHVTAGQKLSIDADTILLSRQAILRSNTDFALGFGVDEPSFVASLAGSLSSLAAPVIEIGANTRVEIEQGDVFTDDLNGVNGLVLAGGVVTLDVKQVDVVEYGELWDVVSTINGPITGAGALTKTGDGALVLNGASNYAGATSFEGGTVELNGSLGGPAPVVVTDTTLYAGGNIAGSLTIGDGSTLVIGSQALVVDTINTGPLTFKSGSSLELEISAGASDRVNVSGAVTIETGSAVELVTLDGYLPPAGQQVMLINNDTAADPVMGGFSQFSAKNLAGEDQNGALTYIGGDGNDISFLGVTMEMYLDADGNLVIRDKVPGGRDDSLTITYDTVNQVITFNDPHAVIGIVGVIPGSNYVGEHTVSVPFSSITGEVQINTLGGNDSLTITGGAAVETITHRPTAALDGSIDMTGRSRVSYVGVETIDDQLMATNRTFEFWGGGETISVGDATANDSRMRIDSTLGPQIDFRLPSSLLSVLAGSGDDTVNLNSLDSQFAASLVIDGGGGVDGVNLLTSIWLASGKT
ncbi:MAG TPA: autotransporter-associated beta strand repeat-containing protein, partial [Pirellulaceae bacterium]|nr:autotransporter-associated beta strand repeat-containing protein [Pirellulaceae bacterium]